MWPAFVANFHAFASSTYFIIYFSVLRPILRVMKPKSLKRPLLIGGFQTYGP